MKIGIVLFDGFTDLDFFLAWDLLNRVRLLKLSDDWEVLILGNKFFFQSAAGLQVPVHKSYEFANPIPTRDSFIQEGHVATASRCLSGTELALWVIENLAGKDIATQVHETIKPLKELN